METIDLEVPGISCDHCVKTIDRAVGDVPGVLSTEGDVEQKRVRVRFEPPASQEQIVAAMTEWGYPPAV